MGGSVIASWEPRLGARVTESSIENLGPYARFGGQKAGEMSAERPKPTATVLIRNVRLRSRSQWTVVPHGCSSGGVRSDCSACSYALTKTAYGRTPSTAFQPGGVPLAAALELTYLISALPEGS
eukprot:443010-Prymnesium_polylepis.1